MKKLFSVKDWVNVRSDKNTAPSVVGSNGAGQQELVNVSSTANNVVAGTSVNNPGNVPVVNNAYNADNRSNAYNTDTTREDVERVIKQIEVQHVDITSDYHDWVKIGFAFAAEFGKNGRGYFNRVSRMYPNYKQKDIDKQYNKCLGSKGSGVTIASFFQIAKEHGIDISKPKCDPVAVASVDKKPTDRAASEPTQKPTTSPEPNGFMDFWFLKNQLSLPLLEYKPVNEEAKEERLSSATSDTVAALKSYAESKDVTPKTTEEPQIQEPMVFAEKPDKCKDGKVESAAHSVSGLDSESIDNQSLKDDIYCPSSASHSTQGATALEPPKTKNPKNHLVAQESKWILEEEELPHFPQSVYDSLPPFLRQVMDCSSQSEDRDMVLMGTLTCLSATLHNVCGKYDGNVWYPMLYFFVMADAGMGKGALTYCRQLVVPINKQLREISEQQIHEYKEAQKLAKQDGEHASGEEPKRRTLFIPTNSSASAFVEQLDNNEGIGLMFDTECDTLSAVLKSDFGDYSSYLRKAYHHEPIEISRRKDNEFRCIEEPKLALCLSGTPEQLHTLTPDAENGLYSRILTYHIPFRAEFRDTLVEDAFDDDVISSSLRERFYKLGLKYQQMRESFFRGGSYFVCIPGHLCSVFNSHFREVNQQTVDEVSNAMQGIVRRIAFAVFRIMMVLTAIRFMDEVANPSALAHGGKPVRLTCSDEDFHIAMEIGKVLTYHSIYCYAHLPKTVSSLGNGGKVLGKREKMKVLLEALPDCFDKSQFKAVSESLKFSPNTTAKWINNYIADGCLERDSKDHYRKTGMTSDEVLSHPKAS